MRSVFTAGILLVGCVLPARADDAIPIETLKEIKAATVFVKVDAGRGKMSGSGFLMRVDGETGYVVTNHHVVVPPPELKLTVRTIELVFHSGQKGEKVVTATVIASDSDRDLAILKITGVKDLPKPLDLTQKVELIETMGVYTFGFPFGEKLSLDKGNPAMTVGKGSVSSIRLNERGETGIVQIDGELNPGNSGGPVVDAKGRLVGVAVAKIDKTRIGFAIPPEELTHMFNGRISVMGVKVVKVENGVAEVDVEMAFIDPFGNIKSATVHYLRADQIKMKLEADKMGVWPALTGAEKAAIKVENQKGTVRLKIACDEKKVVAFVFQPMYVNGDNKEVFASPTNRNIEFGKMIVDSPMTPSPKTIEGDLIVRKLALTGARAPRCLFFSNDGKSFYHLDSAGVVRRVALADEKEEARLEIGKQCSGMAPSAEGIVVAVSASQEVWLLDAKTLAVKQKISVPGVQTIASSPKLSVAYAGRATNDSLSVLDLKTGKSAKEYSNRDFKVSGGVGFRLPQVSPDGLYLFTLGGPRALQRFKIEGQEINYEENSPSLYQAEGRVEGIDISPDGKRVCLAMGGGNSNVDNTPNFKPYWIHVFAAADLSKPLTTLKIGPYPIAIGFDPKAGLIYGQNFEKQFIVFDNDGGKLKEVQLNPNREFIRQILVHPDGRKALVMGDSIWFVELPKP